MNENKSQKTYIKASTILRNSTVATLWRWAEWKQKLEDASWSLIVKRKELLTEQTGSLTKETESYFHIQTISNGATVHNISFSVRICFVPACFYL